MKFWPIIAAVGSSVDSLFVVHFVFCFLLVVDMVRIGFVGAR